MFSDASSTLAASTTSERTRLRSDFSYRKISHTRRHSSSFAKRHARLACSLVNALTTAHSRYHLFARCAFGANISMVRQSHNVKAKCVLPFCRKHCFAITHIINFYCSANRKAQFIIFCRRMAAKWRSNAKSISRLPPAVLIGPCEFFLRLCL